jgi:hypothetical protein
MSTIIGRSPVVQSKKSLTKQYRLSGTLDEVVDALQELGSDNFYFQNSNDAALKGVPLAITQDGRQLVCTLKTGPLAADYFESAIQAFEEVFGP